MDVSNASLYDGASALAEACLMAVRAHRRSKSARILMPDDRQSRLAKRRPCDHRGAGPRARKAACDPATGCIDPAALAAFAGEDITALVIPQPNFFGQLEDVDALTRWARANGALVIAAVNPCRSRVMKPPGEWGDGGADIACGDAQPFGVPLSSGGPYFGFMACRMEHVRQMPGRIAGRTVDAEGKPGFTLTLQAREQHIRRAKATSNICTNQGLLMSAATIHLALLGPAGLERVARACIARTGELVAALTQLPGVRAAFSGAALPRGGAEARPAGRTRARGARGRRHHRRLRSRPRLSRSWAMRSWSARPKRARRADIETFVRALGGVLGRAAAA